MWLCFGAVSRQQPLPACGRPQLARPLPGPRRVSGAFAAIVAEIEADMAEQLARVREMEKNGELTPIPEVSATTE